MCMHVYVGVYLCVCVRVCVCVCFPVPVVALRLQGHLVHPGVVYDTIRVTCNTDVADIYKVRRRAKELKINLRYYPDNSVRGGVVWPAGGGVVWPAGGGVVWPAGGGVVWPAGGGVVWLAGGGVQCVCCCRLALLWMRL